MRINREAVARKEWLEEYPTGLEVDSLRPNTLFKLD
jgi:hypothetical protein